MLWVWYKNSRRCVGLPFRMISQSSEHKAAPQKYQIYWDFWTTPQERLTRLTDHDGHVTGVVYSNTNGQSVIAFICHRKFCSAGVLQNPQFPVLQKVKLLLYWRLLSCDQPSSSLQPTTAETPAREYLLKVIKYLLKCQKDQGPSQMCVWLLMYNCMSEVIFNA